MLKIELPPDCPPGAWTRSRGGLPAGEREKRRAQVMAVARSIQPTTSRGVGYRMLNLGLIDSKEQFDAVTRLVRELRDDGFMPFDWIVDEGRPMWLPARYKSLPDFVRRVLKGFYLDAWNEAKVQVVVGVEKLALYGVFESTAQKYDVPIVASRGFNSITKSNDLAEFALDDRRPIFLINLGDHDPSGVIIMLAGWRKLQKYAGREVGACGLRAAQARTAVRPAHALRSTRQGRAFASRPPAQGDGGRPAARPRKPEPVYDFDLGHVDLDALDPNVARLMLDDYLASLLPKGALERNGQRIARGQRVLDKLVEHWEAVVRFLRGLP